MRTWHRFALLAVVVLLCVGWMCLKAYLEQANDRINIQGFVERSGYRVERIRPVRSVRNQSYRDRNHRDRDYRFYDVTVANDTGERVVRLGVSYVLPTMQVDPP